MSDRAMPGRTTAMCGLLNAVGGGLAWGLVPALMASIATDLHVSHLMGGVLWGAAPLGIAVAAPMGGAAVDRFGARRVAGLAMLVGALACAARAGAWDGPSMAVAMFAFGLHIGFVAPSVPKALAGHVPIQHLGRANGIALLCYTASTAVTILVARTVIVPALGGWRPAMIAAAIAMGAAGFLWLVVVRDRGTLSRHADLGTVFRLAKNPQLRRVAAIHVLLFGGYLAMLGFLPRALIESGMAPAHVGIAIASWLGIAGVANLAGPWLSDRLGRRRPFVIGGSLLAAGALATMALLPAAQGVWLLGVAAIGGGCFAPLLFTLPLERPSVGPARAGAALGLLMLVGQLGGFVLPILAGAAAQGAGLAGALALLALAHAAIVIPARGLQEPSGADLALDIQGSTAGNLVA
jgi:NNP family nitrate/nitrite transporter-like MFS transporter